MPLSNLIQETLNASFTSALDHPQGVYPGFSINNANNQQRYGNHEEFVSTPQTSLSQLISVSSGRNQGSAENGNLAGGLEEQQDTQGVLLTLNNRNSRKQKRDEETEEFGEMKYNDTLIASVFFANTYICLTYSKIVVLA